MNKLKIKQHKKEREKNRLRIKMHISNGWLKFWRFEVS